MVLIEEGDIPCALVVMPGSELRSSLPSRGILPTDAARFKTAASILCRVAYNRSDHERIY